ncbi:MAG: 50S ribosomal protein L6 [Candidatus Improbicoccus devescovinae]|nr:MAG: 50S ribosomal protein L6 [Candidatus Improbicoccus devescovinae]
MSRIGRRPINIPNDVKINYENNIIKATGVKGELVQSVHKNMKLEISDNIIKILRPDDSKINRSLHGLTRSLVFNMIEGVSKGFVKVLEIHGVGYRAQKQGQNLVMSLGYSHQVILSENEDIKLEVKGNKITVLGADKQKVGQFAAIIREKRPPDPYKAKGIRYSGEIIRRKEAKAGKSGKK